MTIRVIEFDPHTAEQSAIMSVRLGISPIGWSNDDLPELGGDIPLDTCLAEA
jgi:hypothetical protein